MHSHLGTAQSWSFPIGLTVGLAVGAIVYVHGWLRIRRESPRTVPIAKLTAFLSGLVFIWIVAGSPLSRLHHQLLTAHMVQHLILAAGAAPLILLGAPFVAVIYALPQGGRSRVSVALRPPWLRSLGRAVTHPVFCLLAASVTLIAWHMPKWFELSMRSNVWHNFQQVSFLATGLLLWWPVIQPWPSTARWPQWSIPLYLFFATLPCDALSAFLTFYDHALYPSYQSGSTLFNLSPLADQQLAGSLMWVCVTLIYLIPAVAITVNILSPSHRTAEKGTVPIPALEVSRREV